MRINAYLSEKGFEVREDIIYYEDICFIEEMFKKLPWEINNVERKIYYRGEDIDQQSLSKVTALRYKYENSALKEKNMDIFEQKYNFLKAIELLHDTLYKSGYYHKHSKIKLDEVIKESSILITSIALHSLSPKQIKLQSNNRYEVVCPFNKECNEPLVLYEATQMFHCPVCKENGNIFEYVSKILNISFITAVETIATAFDVNLTNGGVDTEHYLVKRIMEVMTSEEYSRLLTISENQRRTTQTVREKMELKPKRKIKM